MAGYVRKRIGTFPSGFQLAPVILISAKAPEENQIPFLRLFPPSFSELLDGRFYYWPLRGDPKSSGESRQVLPLEAPDQGLMAKDGFRR